MVAEKSKMAQKSRALTQCGFHSHLVRPRGLPDLIAQESEALHFCGKLWPFLRFSYSFNRVTGGRLIFS